MRRKQWLSLGSGLLVGTLLALAVPTLAATGDALILGEGNKANRLTVLMSGGATTLKITNTKTGIPLELKGSASVPPMVVQSSQRVQYLNADLLDGNDAAAFSLLGHDHDTDYLAIDAKAADADRLDGLNSTAFVQRGLRCAPGATLEGVATNGSAMCSRDYGSRVIDLPPYVVSSGGEQDPDMGLDNSGNPVIAYYYKGKVYVTGCDDPSCAGGEPWAEVDGAVATSTGVPSPHVQVWAGPSSNVTFAYYHYTAGGGVLRMAVCGDATCSWSHTNLDLVTGGSPFPWDLAVHPTTQRIYLVYEDSGGLKFKDCDSTLFFGGTCTTTTIDAQGTQGSLYVQAGSTPIVAFYDKADDKVYAWNPSSGSKAVANAGTSPGATAIARASNGWPVVAFALTPDPVVGTGDVWVVQCTYGDCSTKSAPSLVSEDGKSDGDIGLVLDSNLPVVAWVGGGGKVAVARCETADCSGTVTQSYLGQDAVGQIAMSRSADGFAVVVYTDFLITIGALHL